MPFEWDAFLIILARVSGLFLSAPIFASRQIPGKVKILTVIVLTVSIACFVPLDKPVDFTKPAAYILALVIEVFIGYSIGFVAYAVFAAIQLAGQLMDMQMGFGMVNVVDPQSGMQIPLMGNFAYLIALLMYLQMNGHHYLIQAIVQSYKIVPVMGMNLGADFTELIVQITAYIFVIAVKVSVPIIFAVLLADIAMGFIARTVPQMNVFIVGLPLKIMVGLVALLLLFQVYMWLMEMLFTKFLKYLDIILITMGI